MTKKTAWLLSIISIFLLWSMALAENPNMREGLWEISVNMKMPEVPMQLPTQIHTQCMTRKELIPQKGAVQNCSGCKILETKIKGDTVYWIEECNAPDGTVRAEGKITYSGESLKGKVKITQGNMTMWQDISGKWVGKCNK